MATYEYECQKCRKKFSISHPIAEHEGAKPKCPHCNSAEVKQLITPFAAQTSKKS